MTPQERAVIEAARLLYRNPSDLMARAAAVMAAIERLDAANTGTEIGWHEVAEGDELRSPNNGKFYPVLAATSTTQGYRIKLQTGSKETVITRPTESEPTARVRRGQVGQAIDVVKVVFSG